MIWRAWHPILKEGWDPLLWAHHHFETGHPRLTATASWWAYARAARETPCSAWKRRSRRRWSTGEKVGMWGLYKARRWILARSWIRVLSTAIVHRHRPCMLLSFRMGMYTCIHLFGPYTYSYPKNIQNKIQTNWKTQKKSCKLRVFLSRPRRTTTENQAVRIKTPLSTLISENPGAFWAKNTKQEFGLMWIGVLFYGANLKSIIVEDLEWPRIDLCQSKNKITCCWSFDRPWVDRYKTTLRRSLDENTQKTT